MRQRDLTERVATDTARIVILTCLRVIGSTAALVGAYAIWPLDHDRWLPPVASLVIGVVSLALVFVLQVRAIIRAPQPAVRAVEGLAASIPLLLISFAAAYVAMSDANADAFSEPLSKTAAIYFAITVFSTVGFGDITPVTDPARLVVAVQMVLDLLVLGVGLRVVVGAVQKGREQRAADVETGR
jgi:voltage-gated potassium channel